MSRASKPSLRFASTTARRVGITLLVLVQVTLLSISGLYASARWIALPVGGNDPYVLLVLGSDQGPPRTGTALGGRADGFHLLVVAPDRAHVSILSFPRDTWVSIPGVGNRKINKALTYGADKAVATAESVTGLEVDDWIVTTFNGLQAGVDLLGGVELDVETRLRDRSSGSNLQPGVQVLTGPQSLSYLRDRHSRAGGDLDRSESHARFLQAIHAQLYAEGIGPARLAELLGQLERVTDSSLSTSRLFALGALAMQIQPENVARVRVDARVGTAGAASVVRLTDAGRVTIRELAENGIFSSLQD